MKNGNDAEFVVFQVKTAMKVLDKMLQDGKVGLSDEVELVLDVLRDCIKLL